MMVAPGVRASPFVLEYDAMPAAVRKDGGDDVFAGKADDGGVNVKVPLTIEDFEQALKSRRAVAVHDLYSRWGTANYRHAIAKHCELYGDNVAEPESAQWACATATSGIRAANRRVEPVESYRLAIDLELATHGAAVGIGRGGGHDVRDAEHKLVGKRIVSDGIGPGITGSHRRRIVSFW